MDLDEEAAFKDLGGLRPLQTLEMQQVCMLRASSCLYNRIRYTQEECMLFHDNCAEHSAESDGSNDNCNLLVIKVKASEISWVNVTPRGGLVSTIIHHILH